MVSEKELLSLLRCSACDELPSSGCLYKSHSIPSALEFNGHPNLASAVTLGTATFDSANSWEPTYFKICELGKKCQCDCAVGEQKQGLSNALKNSVVVAKIYEGGRVSRSAKLGLTPSTIK